MIGFRVKRRTLLAVGLSLGVHALAAGLIVASSLWDAWPRQPIDVEITGMRLEDLKDLPLGVPPSGPAPTEGVPLPQPIADAASRPKTKSVSRDGAKEDRDQSPEARDARASGGGPAPPRPTSVRSYAPAGSRVSALLRVDRLRGTPYAPVVDALLMHLPDRRDLLAGTGLDLFRDVDAVLIATPNPLDPTVTFLAVRHRLSDAALRSALDRGARATGRKFTWRMERGRPFAERNAIAEPSLGSGGIGGAAINDAQAATIRDHRLILLAAPKLVVVTPPAYRGLILKGGGGTGAGAGGRSMSGANESNAGAAGIARNAGAVSGDGDAGQPPGAPAPDAAAGASPENANDWATLIRRIDAEDSIMPPDAVAMVSAADLFSARTLRGTLDVASGARGSVDDAAPAPAPSPVGPTIMGLPVPPLLTATMGITPQPFADVEAEFAREEDALRWEVEWPKLRHKLLTNPLVVLSGFGGLVSHAVLARTGVAIHVRIDATPLEATRLLQILTSQLPTTATQR